MYRNAGFAHGILYFFTAESTTNQNESYGTCKTTSANWLEIKTLHISCTWIPAIFVCVKFQWQLKQRITYITSIFKKWSLTIFLKIVRRRKHFLEEVTEKFMKQYACCYFEVSNFVGNFIPFHIFVRYEPNLHCQRFVHLQCLILF